MNNEKKQPTIEDKVGAGYVDLTKTGPLSYRELRNLNNSFPAESFTNAQRPDNIGVESALQRAGKVNYTDQPTSLGESMFDPGIANQEQIENLQDYRAEAQPWYAQLGAGIAKGAILAGTTFLDGTVGLLFGAAEAINRGDWSGLWDNDFSRALKAANDWSEEVMPNYYSYEEQNSPWYTNIFTANFLGDKFIKNLGFSIGALYSGGVTAAGLRVTKLPQLIGAITRSTKAPAVVSTLVGAVTSAVNEGRIEALNNSTDWQNLKIRELDDQWGQSLDTKYAPSLEDLNAEYQAAFEEYEATKGKLQRVGTGDSSALIDLAAERYKAKIAAIKEKEAILKSMRDAEFNNRESDPTYRKVIGKIEEDRLKMGNVDLLLNIPILTASNIVQFTKFYSNGFNTARRAGVRTIEGATGGAARYAGKTFSKGRAALKAAKVAVAEGTEEISQKGASVISGNYYSTDVNNFYKAQMDPNAEQETLSWAKAFSSGINETVNEGSSWEEFFIGALTGLMGVPTFRSIRSADGSFRSPITLQGGAINEVREYRESIKRSEEIANYLNQRVQSPEFLNYYRGMIRHNKYQNDMDKAVEEGDRFNFKNAEHAQFVSDIIMFDNAGKLEDLRTYIESAYDMSDENLQSIVENTTSTDKNDNKVGPFVDKNGNPLYATEEGKQQMIEKLTQTKDDMISTLDNYRRVKNDLDINTGGALSDEQLSELTWLKTQIDDWSKRANEITPLVKRALIDLSNNLESSLISNLNDASMDGVEAIESVNRVSNRFNVGADRIQQLKQLALMDNKRLAAVLTSPKNTNFVDGLAMSIASFGSDIISSLDKQNVIQLIQDLSKLGRGIETYNSKLEEYLTDPAKLAAAQAEAEESVRQETQRRRAQSTREALSATTSLEEFRTALNKEEDKELSNSIIEDLVNEGNQIAKNYKETLQYDNELRSALNQLGETEQATQDALSLWEDQVNLAENLGQIAYPGSVAINNREAFLEDSGGDIELANTRFENARYALQRAMSRVNNDVKFKDRFSEIYKKPVDEPIRGRGRGIDKDKTGDSGVSTVPYVAPNIVSTETFLTPVGNITAEMVASENNEANKRVETQRTLDQKQQGQRKYYRPAVPELHIEASKEGDFRPFDVVVAERETGVDFSEIYSYLRDNGAFDYVNAAKIKPGDFLGFMIDPEFNDHTIFLVDTRNNQIVGSIDESEVSVARYEGLGNLIKKVRDEYQNSSKQSNKPFYNSETGLLSEKYVESLIKNSPEIPYETLTWNNEQNKSVASSGKSRIIDLGGRKIVVIDINGFHMPFYLSTGHGGKVDVESGKWYPIFGVGADGWLNKLSGTEINDYYKSPIFKQISEALDRIYGDIREDSSVPSVKATGSHIDFINQDLHPTENSTKDTRVDVEKNIELAKYKIVEAASKLTTLSSSINTTNTSGASNTTQQTGVKKFFATPQVRVSKMMVGRIPYSSEERSLADIPGVADSNTKPIFGIIKNGVLTTNEKIDDGLIIKPTDMAQKEGRLYLLIPNAAGTYSPAAVRVKHFNTQEFNLNDVTVANTPMGKSINEALDKLADAASQDDISTAMKELSQDIYMQDVMITWFDANAGSGIVISKKVRKSDGTYEMITINGQEQIKEEKTTVYFQSSKKTATINGMEVDIEAAKELGADLSLFGQPRPTADIRRDILNTILSYNLPLQVSTSKINESGYNNRIIKSNILTSNLREAKVIGSWFTTDYFDNQGNLQRAINPAPIKPAPGRKLTTPVGGGEGVVQGTRVSINGTSYIVDLKSSIVINESTGEKRSFSALSSKILIDMAWAQETFGDATESSIMTDNKIITPNGEVLDRAAGKYLTGTEAQEIKDKIAGKDRGSEIRIAQSKRVIAEISENQKKVDKERTDKDYYYILEEDGQYHKYSRVHSRLGDNWLGERTETENSKRALEAGTAVDQVIRDFFTSKKSPVRPEALSDGAFIDLLTKLTEIKSKMEQLGETFMTNNIVLFQKYTDGTRVAGEVDVLSVDKDGNFKIYDVKTSKYSFNSRYFNEKSSMQRMSTKDYYTLQLSAYQNLFESQYGVRPTNLAILPFVLTYGATQATTVDIPSGTQTKLGLPIASNQSYFRTDRKVEDDEARFVSSEKGGKIYFKPILDTKAHELSFKSEDIAHSVVELVGGSHREATSYVLIEPGEATRDSNGRLVVSKKAKIFAVTPNTPYSSSRSVVTTIVQEKGIPITYNPAVNVPLASAVRTPASKSSLPIFNSTIETMITDPKKQNRVLPENAFEEGGEVGYYEKDGKLYTGYLKKIGEVEVTYESGQKGMIPIHVTKVRDIGLGRAGEFGSTSEYLTVFPNGKAISTKTNDTNDSHAAEIIMKALSAKPEKVLSLSSEETQIHSTKEPLYTIIPPSSNSKSIIEKQSQPEPPTLEGPSAQSQGGAARAIQKEDAINKKTAKRTRHKLRAKDSARPIWNREKELAWLEKVLPQLSEQDRVRVVKGLIQVSENGPIAWGMFSNGIVTLSDIAAEGTTYHESFHVVFNLALTPQERLALFTEARQQYGDKSEAELEEDMAEEFREYITSQETRGLGRRIIDFFKDLFAKVTNWKYVKPSLNSYYRMINQGKYRNSNLGVSNDSKLRQEEPTSEMQSIKERAIADGTFMKAPNGKPTNLNERQWLQVRTKAFKSWFGDWINDPKNSSKVLDENGEPLIVYHGSARNFNTFATDKIGSMSGEQSGFYFTNKRRIAKDYYSRETGSMSGNLKLMFHLGGYTPSVYDVFLNSRNPYIATLNNDSDYNNRESIIKEAREQGYDSVLFRDVIDGPTVRQDTRIVFGSNQIKSATNNAGTFSTINNDIRYREVDINDSEFKDLKQDLTSFFNNFGITIKDVSKFDSEEPIFNALDRVINFNSIESLTDNAGYAIAFMMQYNTKIKDLISIKQLGSPVKMKGLRRAVNKGKNYDFKNLTDREYKSFDKTPYLKEIGKDVGEQLRLLYSKKPINTSDSFFRKLWSIISEFFNKMTSETKLKFSVIRNYTNSIANAVKLGDYTIIRRSDFKPGTDTLPSIVDIGEAFKNNPYEESIVSTFNKHGISLAGGAAIASQGTLYRPSENPLHDLDFEARNKSKEEIESILRSTFKAYSHTNTIVNEDGRTTYTYLVMDREFEERRDISGIGVNVIYDKKTGERLGTRIHSELVIEKEGVKGKMLDFFTGDTTNVFDNVTINYNGKNYLFSDYRNAMSFKINVARLKDIWDYNRFIPRDENGKIVSLAELKNSNKERVQNLVRNARIIWGHPAIGKTTYLERNNDILEWDEEINPKRDIFVRNQIDPNHTMDINSIEYKRLKQEYMSNWKNNPEYIEFLTREWNNLKDRAQRENKRLFASPIPLLSIFRNDFDLVVALPEKQFIERNKARGGSEVGSLNWKQALDRQLIEVDPNKIVYTDKYFSEFMRDTLGVTWGTLNNTELEALQAKGWSEERFNSVSQEEREQALECVAL